MLISAVISLAALVWLSWRYARRVAVFSRSVQVSAGGSAEVQPANGAVCSVEDGVSNDLTGLVAAIGIVTALVGLLALVFVLPHAIIHFAMLGGLFLILSQMGVRHWGWFAAGGVLAAVPVYQADVREIWALTRDVAIYAEQYPLEPLAGRLAYENSAMSLVVSQATPVDEPLVAPRLGMAVLSVVEVESDDDHYYYHMDGHERRHALSVIHDEWRYQFENVMGMGNIRMRWIFKWRDGLIELPAAEAIYLPDEYTGKDQLDADLPRWLEFAKQFLSERMPMDWSALHLVSTFDFVNPAGWGYRPYDAKQIEVAGFQSHHFRRRPLLINGATNEVDRWRIVKLQLVSLLKHETPRVYLDEALPNMERLSSETAPTRDLDDFEERALKKLIAGNDLAVEEHPERIRMLGSLRTVQQCTKCHNVPEQTLLGAFSYELRLSPLID